MKSNFQENPIFSIVEENLDQLNLFENENMSEELKYARRQKRSVAGKKFKINEPTQASSNSMKKISSKETTIELLFEQEMILKKIVYTKPETLIKEVEGKPDFILPRSRIAIFCDGDFWHGRTFQHGKVKNNGAFWDAKIENNILRDEQVNYILSSDKWDVMRFWENEIRDGVNVCVQKVIDRIKEKEMNAENSFTFVDLFSGIGGFRIALEKLGGRCLAFSEIDRNAIKVYKKNFFNFQNEEEKELGDITKVAMLPFSNIDLIVGGVPCQAWSVAGKMKGFDDPRGKLWHDTIRVIGLNKPKVFLFENVKGLMDPRNRESLNLILESFKQIGYFVPEPQLLNSYDFGLPQNRDRIFIVGIRNDLKEYFKTFKYPNPIDKNSYLKDIINGVKSDKVHDKSLSAELIHGEKIPRGINRFQNIDALNEFFIFCDTRNGHTTIHSWDLITTTQREKAICMTILKNRRKKIYGNADGNPLPFEVLEVLIPDLKRIELEKLVNKRILRNVSEKGYEFVNSKNSSGINGIYRIYLPHSNIFSTLTATGTKDHVALVDIHAGSTKEYRERFISEIVKKRLFREITAKEAGKLQGFPEWFSIHEDVKHAKKQFGNAVSTSVVYYLAKEILGTKVFNDVR